MELSSSNIRKFLIFSQTKAFLIFWEMELSSSNIFSIESFSYISGNGNPEKILYISGSNFP